MKQVSVVISSCDKYHYLWDIQLQVWAKHWPDCPYDVYMLSEHGQLPEVEVPFTLFNCNTNRPVTGAGDWSLNLIDLLSHLDSEYMIYSQEDYIFLTPVDTNRLGVLMNYVAVNKLNYVRFYLSPGGNGDRIELDENLSIREILPNSPWRSNLSMAIWKREVLLETLRKHAGIAPWSFEHVGCNEYDKFYCIDTVLEGETDIFPWYGMYGSSNGYGIYPTIEPILTKFGIKKADGSDINYDIRL